MAEVGRWIGGGLGDIVKHGSPRRGAAEDVLRRRGTAATDGDEGDDDVEAGTWGRRKEVSESGCHHMRK